MQKLSYHDLEKIENYLSNNMNVKEKTIFESEIEENRELKEKFILRQQLEHFILDTDVINFKKKLHGISDNFFKNHKSEFTVRRKAIKQMYIIVSVFAICFYSFSLFVDYKQTQYSEHFYSVYENYDEQPFLYRKHEQLVASPLLLQQGVQFFHKKMYNQSILYLTDFLTESKGEMQSSFSALKEGQYYLSLSYYKLGEFEKAIDSFNKLLGQNLNKESFLEAKWKIALSHLQLHQISTTINILKDIYQIDRSAKLNDVIVNFYNELEKTPLKEMFFTKSNYNP